MPDSTVVQTPAAARPDQREEPSLDLRTPWSAPRCRIIFRPRNAATTCAASTRLELSPRSWYGAPLTASDSAFDCTERTCRERRIYALRRARSAHGNGTRVRRMQDRESDTGYDTRLRSPDGARARLSQTTVYDTILTGHARPTPDRSGPKCHLSHSGCWLDVKSPSHK